MADGTGSNDLGQPGRPKHGSPGRERFVALVAGPQEPLSFLDQTLECSADAAGIAGLSSDGQRENLRHLGLAFPIESIALELCFGREAIRPALGSVAELGPGIRKRFLGDHSSEQQGSAALGLLWKSLALPEFIGPAQHGVPALPPPIHSSGQHCSRFGFGPYDWSGQWRPSLGLVQQPSHVVVAGSSPIAGSMGARQEFCWIRLPIHAPLRLRSGLYALAIAGPKWPYLIPVHHCPHVGLQLAQDFAIGPTHLGSEGYRHKYCSMSYLDWNLAPGLQVGLFQAIVWPAQDTLGHRGIDWNYLNPLLFMIPMQFANGSDGNALVGINTGYRWGRQQIYAQAVLDELRMKDLLQGSPTWANKFAFQAGIRGWTSVVGQGLRWQAEVNGARPFTYAHWSGATNYAHQNSALAHPMGANFVEALGSIAWFRGPWSLTLRHLIAQQGRSDSTGLNTGNNIHASYWNGADPSGSYPWLNGVPVRLQQGELSLSRLLDPLTGLRLQLTTWWRYRQSTNAWAQGLYGQRSLGFNLTLLTRIDNFYHDY